MSEWIRARAAWRVLTNDVSLGTAAGALAGLALGGAYLVGGLASDAALRAKAERILAGANGDISQSGLEALAASDPKALELALRYDPTLLSVAAYEEQKEAQLVQALAARNASPSAAGRTLSHPAAQPWNASPLDQARQLDCLTQAVYYEARGETPSGQAAVAQVVLNRVRHPSFPNSICAVVYQGAQKGRGCQFSFACNGSMRARREPGAWKRAEKIAARALDGYVMAEIGNATHFHVTSVNPRWNLIRVGQVGMHVFYRFGGRNGSPGAFVAEPEREPESLPQAVPILASLTIEPIELPQDGALVKTANAAPVETARAEAAEAPAAETARPAAAPAPKPAVAAPARTEAATAAKPS